MLNIKKMNIYRAKKGIFKTLILRKMTKEHKKSSFFLTPGGRKIKQTT
jgi:hypothetical protein